MPTALSTTKRKFHKLLDSISNASSSSLPLDRDQSNASSITLPAPAGSPAKRARFARPVSAHAAASNTKETGLGLQIRRPVSTMAATAAGSTMSGPDKFLGQQNNLGRKEPNEAPNFAPWDREQFLSRLKTFRHVDKWTGKPDKINEVEWARRGWSCVGRETVGCVGGCRKEVVIQLVGQDEEDPLQDEDGGGDEEGEQEWRKDAQKELIQRYAEMISTAHEGSCLWRRRGCDDTIQRLPVIQYASTIDDLRIRYESLLAMSSELPRVVSSPSDPDIARALKSLTNILTANAPTQQGIKAVEYDNNRDTSTAPAIPSPAQLNKVAALLALFGWQGEEKHIAGLATCNACFRRLGLWLFQSAPPSKETERGGEAERVEEDEESSPMARLDIVSEHRDYCPWINALSQNGSSRRKSSDGLSGWAILLRTILSRNVSAQNAEDENEDGAQDMTETGSGRNENQNPPSSKPITEADLTNETPEKTHQPTSTATTTSTLTTLQDEEHERLRNEKDKERWAKLRKVRQVFQINSVSTNGKNRLK